MMLQMPNASEKLNRLSTYYSAGIIARDWMQPINAVHEIYSVTIDPSEAPVSAYAVHRPDRQWALLAINKDPNHSAHLAVEFRSWHGTSSEKFFGQVAITQFSREQYRWQDEGENGRPTLSNPPTQVQRPASDYYELPPYSVSVLRGKVARP
jgi:hypothetical protein